MAAYDAAAVVTNVILASGENGRAADALGASFLAGVRGAPVLLTPQATLSATTRAELTRLRTTGATSVTIVGGPAAVSATVQAEVTALGYTVTRLGGVDRFQTAELVVAAGEGASASNVGIVASGISTVDALAVGPLAYKGKHPIFLTRAASIPASTIASMKANGVTSVYIVGGETVVSAAVRSQLTAAGITVVDRLAGQTRSGTSVAIASAIIGGTFGFINTTFNVASGANNGVDALSGAALSGLQNRALLITDTATNAGAVTAFATARAATLNAAGIIFGGPAAVSVEVEAAIEAAGGATTASGVSLVNSTVQQGGTLSGNVSGTNVKSVTVSGCGFTNSPVAIGPFSLVIPASTAVGSCTLTFTVTDNSNVVTTVTQAVTVTPATVVQGTGTSLPELASATIVQTLAANGTTVRYSFDEALTSTTTLTASNFVVYTFDSNGVADRTPATGTGAAIDASDNRSVLVTFPTITTASDAADLSLATIEANAVVDLQGELNPIGDAALNPSGTTSTPLTGGVTSAPDLVTVGNFRANPGNANATLVDFTFDEAADAATRSGYRLVSTDGVTVRTGNVVSGGGFTGTGATVEGTGTTVHTVEFQNAASGTASTLTLLPASQARGLVLAGTVNEGSGTGNRANALQAADVTGGVTETPDLVSASIVRDATVAGVTGTRDQILYTFDEPVNIGNPANFFAYSSTAVLIPQSTDAAAAPRRSTANANQVLVTFGDAANGLDLAVGASVEAGAVTEGSGTFRVNQADEESIGNVGVGTTTNNVSGRTEAPDLIAVAVERTTDAFGVTSGARVRYTFDEDVVAVGTGTFALYEANGALVAGSGAQAVGTTEDTDNQVIVSYGTASTDAVLRAVLGTVNDGAVGNQVTTDATPAGTGTLGPQRNPEGAQLATGTTGTPRV